MKYRTTRHLVAGWLVAAAAAWGSLALSAAESDEVVQAVGRFDRTANASPTRAEADMAKVFTPLTGSEATALGLIEGLRAGAKAVLDPGSATSIPVTVTPTEPMGYGNVFIALASAQENLRVAGVGTPTSADLAVALNGGSIKINGQLTTFRGILPMHASGMGWGQIAKELGFDLGPILVALKASNDRLAKSINETRIDGNRPAADEGSRGERPARMERSDKAERAERPMRPETASPPAKD